MDEEREELLNDPTGGPSAGSETSTQEHASDAVDTTAGAGGQDEGEGAVEENQEKVEESTGGEDDANPTPG